MGFRSAKTLDNVANDGGEIDALGSELAPRPLRQGQEPVDEAPHFLCIEQDLLEPVLTLRIELLPILVEEHSSEAIHPTQRCPEIVGHGVAECLQLAACGFGCVLRSCQRRLS